MLEAHSKCEFFNLHQVILEKKHIWIPNDNNAILQVRLTNDLHKINEAESQERSEDRNYDIYQPNDFSGLTTHSIRH